jgi:L-iditol 2-dehydrogenase
VVTMQQAWITAPATIELRSVPIPSPGPGEVLVQVGYAGICGSDLHTYRRGHPWLAYPITPGHEGAGVIVEIGPAVADALAADAPTALSVGQQVYLRPAIACGNCFYCEKRLPNLCAHLIGVGSHMPGAFADYLVVPVAALAPVPDGVSLAEAAMIEPLATAVHAAKAAGGLSGRSVVILGAGSIGLSMLLVARAEGAASIAVTDLVASKRQLALDLGASAVFDAADPELVEKLRAMDVGRPDVTIDCVANAQSIRSAAAATGRSKSRSRQSRTRRSKSSARRCTWRRTSTTRKSLSSKESTCSD